ncbi:restriction endonuclease subunit S [Chryseobacterium bernardetii]|uniref:restriction endonuclease subunit S n=1 Tax=Chryseobacterium bernardetii TaxID=1241978 RepID=UPI000F4F1B2F|nr:restriction endonuclease subunit S [Chryseobacterium bernardetii]AZB33543.1 hypothetical protein EG351_07890 [Chryseobacterium bernardetii]
MENKMPKNWVLVELEKLGENKYYAIGDGDHGQIKPLHYKESGIPYIRVSDIGWGNFKPEKLVYISEEIHNKNLKSELLPGDILIAKTGATIGKCCIVPDYISKANTTSSVGKVSINSKLVSNKWILYYFLSPDFYKLMWSKSNRTAQPGFNIIHLKQFLIPLPPLPEQERIVAKLDALFAQHEAMKKALERIPQLLKDFRQQVLTHAVTGNLIPFRGGSQNMKLKDLGIWKGGGTPSKANSSFWNNGTILWITPKDMKDLFLSNSIDKITKSAVQNSSAILIPKNSILIVTRSGILRRLLPISSNSVETTVNQDLKVLIPNDKVNFKFLLYALRGLEENIRMTCMKSGTTVESIEFSLLKDYNINIPILSIQQAIIEKIESLFVKADIIEKRYKTLKQKLDSLPQAILHKAFKGELVPQLPTDGNAKDLLEEIIKLKKEVKKK